MPQEQFVDKQLQRIAEQRHGRAGDRLREPLLLWYNAGPSELDECPERTYGTLWGV